MTFRCPRRKDTVSTTSRPVGREVVCFYRAVSVGTQWESRGKNAWRGLGTKEFPQKKVLSLVLCVAMLLSVMVMGTGAAFTDEDDFSPQYAEAAEVLAGMKVMQGYDDGSFLPQRNITRAQVATMIYRAATGDVNDTKTDIYKDYDKFDDVQSTDWFAGYVGYCANGELIKGFTPTTFGPNKNVTGYQVLAMILRAVGYDANDEFTGSGWEIRTASTAQQLGMLDNVQEATLGQPATRELVAELIFQALNVNMVKYMPAVGYVKQDTTLGKQEFDLTKGERDTIDEWGRPGYDWTYNTGDKSTTIEEAALATYQTAVTECDVADDTNDADATYALYVNSKDNNAGKYTVNATDTTTKIGAQGRLTEVYKDRIVMIDTFLAQVTNVKEAVFDAAGHLRTPATITLAVYDRGYNMGSNTVILTNGETNYTYTEGQMVLLNAYTANGTYNNSTTVLVEKDKTAVYGEIVGAATAITGTQTIIYNNANQHNINGTVYNDALKLNRDDAGDSDANHTWFFDQYNNLIGVTDIAADTNYGVITRMWWNGNNTDGSGTAQADVTYMDGTTGTVTISKMTVSTSGIGTYTEATGVPAYSTKTSDIMTVSGGHFYVTTDATTNAREDNISAGKTNGGNDIINGNLFQFILQGDGTVAALEVAGDKYASNHAELSNVTAPIHTDTVVCDNGSRLLIGSNTQFLIQSETATGFAYETVTGFNNIGDYDSGEVDFVDLNGDKVADYVYITADAENAIMDSLFYYAGGTMEYNVETELWTIPGYVDGEEGNILVEGYNNAVKNTINEEGAHNLYKVTVDNGVVSDAAVTPLTNNAVVTFAHANPAYTDKNINIAVIFGAEGDTYANNLYTDNDVRSYGINADTHQIGTFDEDMSGMEVIVVWDNQGFNANSRLIDQIYSVEKDTTVDDTDITPQLTLGTAGTNSVPAIDMSIDEENNTGSVQVAYNADTVRLVLNYPTGAGINKVTMSVNDVDKTASLSGGNGQYYVDYTITASDLQRGKITVTLTSSKDNGATNVTAEYTINVTGTLIQH